MFGFVENARYPSLLQGTVTLRGEEEWRSEIEAVDEIKETLGWPLLERVAVVPMENAILQLQLLCTSVNPSARGLVCK